MRTVRAFVLRLASFWNRGRREREMSEELETHLLMEIEANVRSGMSPDQARRAALLKSGGLETAKEACRDRRSLPVHETTVQDLRYAVRILRRSPIFTAAAVLSLALGIAAATAILSVLKGILLEPLPYPEPDRLMVVWQRPPEEYARQPLSSPDYFDYRERNISFEEFGVQSLRPVNLSGEGTPERVIGSICTASFLRAVGVMPAMGRLFTDEEEAKDERLILLSHGLWMRRFGSDPGIKLPLEGGTNVSYLVEDEQYDPKADRPLVERSWVTREYFEAMGVRLLAGRLFSSGSASESRSEIIINRAFTRQYFADGNALGKHIYPNTSERNWVGVIVGVVDDAPQWSLELPTLPEVYQPFDSTTRANRFLIVRTTVTPLALSQAVRDAVVSVDREQPVSNIRTMEAVFDGSAARRRFNTSVMEIFAFLGLLMVAVGIYGVISCWVAQRTREVGIRIALGADWKRVAKMVVGRSAAMAAIGISIGATIFLALSRVVENMLYQVRPTDPLAVAGVSLLLLLVALLGSARPAWRAVRVDPVRTLRSWCDAGLGRSAETQTIGPGAFALNLTVF